ncbi:putative quercetin 2 [Diplonema papillatum]|nr:putative quercetin 2 [Diplonema papillatum]
MLRKVERAADEQPARHLAGVGYPSSRAVGPETDLEYLDPLLSVEEVRKDFVKGVPGSERPLPYVPYRQMTRIVYVKQGAVTWKAEQPDGADRATTTKAGQLFVLRANRGALLREEPHCSIFNAGGRLHLFDVWLKDFNVQANEDPLMDKYSVDDLPVEEGPGWTATVLCGRFSNKSDHYKAIAHLDSTRIIDVLIKGKRSMRYDTPKGWNVILYLYDGELEVRNNKQLYRQGAIVVFSRLATATLVDVCARGGIETRFLLIATQPQVEPFEREGGIVAPNRMLLEGFKESPTYRDAMYDIECAFIDVEDEELADVQKTYASIEGESADDRRRTKRASVDTNGDASPAEPRTRIGKRPMAPPLNTAVNQRLQSPRMQSPRMQSPSLASCRSFGSCYESPRGLRSSGSSFPSVRIHNLPPANTRAECNTSRSNCSGDALDCTYKSDPLMSSMTSPGIVSPSNASPQGRGFQRPKAAVRSQTSLPAGVEAIHHPASAFGVRPPAKLRTSKALTVDTSPRFEVVSSVEDSGCDDDMLGGQSDGLGDIPLRIGARRDGEARAEAEPPAKRGSMSPIEMLPVAELDLTPRSFSGGTPLSARATPRGGQGQLTRGVAPLRKDGGGVVSPTASLGSARREKPVLHTGLSLSKMARDNKGKLGGRLSSPKAATRSKTALPNPSAAAPVGFVASSSGADNRPLHELLPIFRSPESDDLCVAAETAVVAPAAAGRAPAAADNPSQRAYDPSPRTNDPSPRANDPSPRANDPSPRANDPSPRANGRHATVSFEENTVEFTATETSAGDDDDDDLLAEELALDSETPPAVQLPNGTAHNAAAPRAADATDPQPMFDPREVGSQEIGAGSGDEPVVSSVSSAPLEPSQNHNGGALVDEDAGMVMEVLSLPTSPAEEAIVVDLPPFKPQGPTINRVDPAEMFPSGMYRPTPRRTSAVTASNTQLLTSRSNPAPRRRSYDHADTTGDMSPPSNYQPLPHARSTSQALPNTGAPAKHGCAELKLRLDTLQRLQIDGTPGLEESIAKTKQQLQQALEQQSVLSPREPPGGKAGGGGQSLRELEENLARYEEGWKVYQIQWSAHLTQLYHRIKENPGQPEMKDKYKKKHAKFEAETVAFRQRQRAMQSLCEQKRAQLTAASNEKPLGATMLMFPDSASP